MADIPNLPEENIYPGVTELTDKFFEESADIGTDAYLEQLLEQRSLNYDDPQVQAIQTAINTTLESLQSAISAHERRFQSSRITGKFIGVGSFHDRTKLAPANEFDFMYILDSEFLEDEFVTVRASNGIPHSVNFRQKTDGLNHCWYDCMKDGHLCSTYFLGKFRTVVNLALKDIVLPEGLVHGGWATPEFSGTDVNGPSVTALFVWTPASLHISVDMVVCFTPPRHVIKQTREALPMVCTQFANDLVVVVSSSSYTNLDWALSTSIVEKKLLTSKLEDSKFAINQSIARKRIILGKMMNKYYLTLHVTSGPNQIIQKTLEENIALQTDLLKTRGHNMMKLPQFHEEASRSSYHRKSRMTDEDVPVLLAVKQLSPDNGLKQMYGVFVRGLKQNDSSGGRVFSDVHPYLRRVLREDSHDYCTIRSCTFKMAAINQVLCASGEQTNTTLLIRSMKRIFEEDKHKVSLLGPDRDTWKVPTIFNQGSTTKQMEQWCHNNALKFLYRLINQYEH